MRLLRSSLYLAAALPHDEEGAPEPGFVAVRSLDDGRLAIHAHQDAAIPPDVEVIRDGSVSPWDWGHLAATHPALYEALCRVELRDEDGTVTGVEYGAPHYWTDDDQPEEGV